jgi:aminoglycoside 6-adenylyltransferase
LTSEAYLELERKVAVWCARQADISAAVVIGSRGRQDGAPDARSDLDLILFCQDARVYQNTQIWLEEFGRVWIAALNFVGPGHPEWMAFLDPGLKIDFLFVTASPDLSLAAMLDSLPYQQVLTHGFRILYQAEAAASQPAPTSARPVVHHSPSEWDFQQKANKLLFTAERYVKFSKRDDWWRSRFTFEAELKDYLLAFVEWHEQAAPGLARDTWYEGRYLEAWAEPRVVKAVRQVDELGRLGDRPAALQALLDLFELLASETAGLLDYEFPTAGQREMLAWLRRFSTGAPDRNSGSSPLTP